MIFKRKKMDWNRELADSEMMNLYEKLNHAQAGSEEYSAIMKNIRDQAAAIESLEGARFKGKQKNKVNWEPILSTIIVAGVTVGQTVMVMKFQEDGHIMDWRLGSLLRNRL